MLDHELKVITGTDTGFVRSAVDQLIEELGIMAARKDIEADIDYKFTQVGTRKILAIRFNKIYPAFKEYARRTQYEGDILDKKSYMQQFEQCDYMFNKSFVVKFDDKPHRCICIDTDKADIAGVDLESFENR